MVMVGYCNCVVLQLALTLQFVVDVECRCRPRVAIFCNVLNVDCDAYSAVMIQTVLNTARLHCVCTVHVHDIRMLVLAIIRYVLYVKYTCIIHCSIYTVLYMCMDIIVR